jgi:hypothetical protein
MMCGRRLALLESDQPDNPRQVLAFVPATAHINDRVCFLRSCPVPFLLRISPDDFSAALDNRIRTAATQTKMLPPRKPRESTGSLSGGSSEDEDLYVDHFKLVGECFVERLMYGLARDLPDNPIYGEPRLVVLH